MFIPCAEQLLPDLDVQFHYLPRDQLDREGLKKMKSFILKDLVFIRAFSMDLLIGEKQDSLVCVCERVCLFVFL